MSSANDEFVRDGEGNIVGLVPALTSYTTSDLICKWGEENDISDDKKKYLDMVCNNVMDYKEAQSEYHSGAFIELESARKEYYHMDIYEASRLYPDFFSKETFDRMNYEFEPSDSYPTLADYKYDKNLICNIYLYKMNAFDDSLSAALKGERLDKKDVLTFITAFALNERTGVLADLVPEEAMRSQLEDVVKDYIDYYGGNMTNMANLDAKNRPVAESRYGNWAESAALVMKNMNNPPLINKYDLNTYSIFYGMDDIESKKAFADYNVTVGAIFADICEDKNLAKDYKASLFHSAAELLYEDENLISGQTVMESLGNDFMKYYDKYKATMDSLLSFETSDDFMLNEPESNFEL